MNFALARQVLVPASCLVVALAASGASQAAITLYTSAAAFAAATSAPGVDTFAGLSTTSATTGPLLRSAGVYSYTASAPAAFFGAGTVADPYLSTNQPGDAITFNTFSSSVRGIGGNFFATDINGAFNASGSVTLVVTDASSAVSSLTISSGSVSCCFVGFVSNVAITSAVLSVVTPAVGAIWATADNLTLATAAAVPEPGTYALWLMGLVALGVAARRRQ
jgi:hypothetical protein